MTQLGIVLLIVLQVYTWALLGRAVLMFVTALNPRWQPRGVVLVLAEIVMTATDPPLKVLGRFIKPIRLGHVSFDLAFVVLWVLLAFAQRALEIALF